MKEGENIFPIYHKPRDAKGVCWKEKYG